MRLEKEDSRLIEGAFAYRNGRRVRGEKRLIGKEVSRMVPSALSQSTMEPGGTCRDMRGQSG